MAPPPPNGRRRRMPLRETTSALWHRLCPGTRGGRWLTSGFARLARSAAPRWSGHSGHPEGVPVGRQRGDQSGAAGGDHVPALVEDRVVAVVRVGHVGGGTSSRIEGAEEG